MFDTDLVLYTHVIAIQAYFPATDKALIHGINFLPRESSIVYAQFKGSTKVITRNISVLLRTLLLKAMGRRRFLSLHSFLPDRVQHQHLFFGRYADDRTPTKLEFVILKIDLSLISPAELLPLIRINCSTGYILSAYPLMNSR